MGRSIPMVAVLLTIVVLVFFSRASASSAAVGWTPVSSGCRGTVGECISGEEFELGSESSRRILATSDYISYQSLKRDSVPCSQAGQSYYNCRPGAQANPYTRGCSAITQCRS